MKCFSVTFAVAALAAFSVSGVLIAGCGIAADGVDDAPAANPPRLEAAERKTFSYEKYDALLRTYVDAEGLVDYAALQTHRGDLDGFNRSMSEIDRAEYEGWPEAEKLALWINAYNAITLQHIIDHYPITKGGLISGMRYPSNSIRQIPGVWKKLTTNIMGRDLTLDSIEHDILREEFDQPRIHAAIVCAALSCPPLRNEAFVADRLDDQLADQSRKFLAKSGRYRIDRTDKKVYLSPILKWFGGDFVGVYNTDDRFTEYGEPRGAVLDFVSRHVSEEDARFLLGQDYAVVFLDYDWTLNEK